MSVFIRPGQNSYSYDFWFYGKRYTKRTSAITQNEARCLEDSHKAALQRGMPNFESMLLRVEELESEAAELRQENEDLRRAVIELTLENTRLRGGRE